MPNRSLFLRPQPVWEFRVIARTRFVRAIAWTGKIAILINKEMTYMLQKVRSERPYVDRK